MKESRGRMGGGLRTWVDASDRRRSLQGEARARAIKDLERELRRCNAVREDTGCGGADQDPQAATHRRLEILTELAELGVPGPLEAEREKQEAQAAEARRIQREANESALQRQRRSRGSKGGTT